MLLAEDLMTQNALDSIQIKELFKEAIVELIQERHDLLYDLFSEIMEDAALIKAIKEGEASEPVSRSDIFKLLEADL
jgi:hypothetical protein